MLRFFLAILEKEKQKIIFFFGKLRFLWSIRKNFTLSDTVASHRSNERRIILLPDMSVIYIQENSKTHGCSPSDCVKASLAEFLDDNISSVVTAHGVCQLGE